METNVGRYDRVLRAALGVALIAMAYANLIGVWGYIGIVPLVTAIIGVCPAYTLFKINTCAAPRAERR